jgi:hypothetical protein
MAHLDCVQRTDGLNGLMPPATSTVIMAHLDCVQPDRPAQRIDAANNRCSEIRKNYAEHFSLPHNTSKVSLSFSFPGVRHPAHARGAGPAACAGDRFAACATLQRTRAAIFCRRPSGFTRRELETLGASPRKHPYAVTVATLTPAITLRFGIV